MYNVQCGNLLNRRSFVCGPLCDKKASVDVYRDVTFALRRSRCQIQKELWAGTAFSPSDKEVFRRKATLAKAGPNLFAKEKANFITFIRVTFIRRWSG